MAPIGVAPEAVIEQLKRQVGDQAVQLAMHMAGLDVAQQQLAEARARIAELEAAAAPAAEDEDEAADEDEGGPDDGGQG